MIMTFDRILDNNKLWAVRYDGMNDNALQVVFEQWSDQIDTYNAGT